MKKHIFAPLTALIILMTAQNLFATNGNMGGLAQDGSADYPYLIQDFADFNEFASDPCYWDDCTRLETDVNLAGETYSTAVIAPDTNNADWDFQGTLFTGIFDGNNHVISNLTIDTADANNHYLGLFGRIDGISAEIKNLGLENVNITGGDSSYYLGGLCGRNYMGGTITNCYCTGLITGGDRSYNTGGLCGTNAGTLIGCYASGSVLGGELSQNVGGLCARNISAGKVINCYSNSKVTGCNKVGGLCGYNGPTTIITNCYSTGNVNGDGYVGGFCGYNYSATISNCYCTGEVTPQGRPSYLGGFCGKNSDTYNSVISNCFWNIETAGDWPEAENYTAIAITTLEMKTISTFTNAGWDFVDAWNISENQTYPFLRKYSSGDLNHDGIVNLSDFASFANHWLEGVE